MVAGLLAATPLLLAAGIATAEETQTYRYDGPISYLPDDMCRQLQADIRAVLTTSDGAKLPAAAKSFSTDSNPTCPTQAHRTVTVKKGSVLAKGLGVLTAEAYDGYGYYHDWYCAWWMACVNETFGAYWNWDGLVTNAWGINSWMDTAWTYGGGIEWNTWNPGGPTYGALGARTCGYFGPYSTPWVHYHIYIQDYVYGAGGLDNVWGGDGC